MNYVQVVSPPGAKLTRLETVKAELEITGTAEDAFLEMLIEEASSYIETYCERRFGKATYIELATSYGRQELLLTHYPVQSVEYVKLHGVEVPASAYEVIKDKGILYNKWGWGWSTLLLTGTVSIVPAPGGELPVYEVKYTAGYVLPGDTGDGEKLPPSIERVCIDLVKIYYFERKRDGSLSSEKMGDYSATFKENKFEGINKILDRFRRVI